MYTRLWLFEETSCLRYEPSSGCPQNDNVIKPFSGGRPTRWETAGATQRSQGSLWQLHQGQGRCDNHCWHHHYQVIIINVMSFLWYLSTMSSQVGADNFIKFDNDIIKEVGSIINQGHKCELMLMMIMKTIWWHNLWLKHF